ncbi:PREDICTED: uncharacterized protein LOC104827557 [Tarenaya hassleriana]|uniref:uncharacterized protein LOC104827557 n=1 Tax=Tarenaya hassleriana TaxID=28532 RepID=UPI00053C40EB|nr:PREDICTED: uncharacterized protein LOC104827557 [Tarenaya hassleriana]
MKLDFEGGRKGKNNDVCKQVECGKGGCKPSSNSTFMFECECESGWKQIDHHLKFLPCIIPNCTMDFACGEAPSPAEELKPTKPKNGSFIDPCHWTDCGGGSCNTTSPFTYTCECQQGYSNLLNVSAFPCFRQCAFGMDCVNLGIPLFNNSASPPPALADSSKSQATRLDRSRTPFLWMMIICLYVGSLMLL